MVHNVASDAHDHVHRPPGIAAELDRAGLAPLADWLTQAVPGRNPG
jgi:tyrosine-protein phosphatase YwqE